MIFKKHEKTLTVDGMHCQKCVARITDALKKIDGIKKVAIDLDKKSVSIVSRCEIDVSVVTAAIQSLGFKVI